MYKAFLISTIFIILLSVSMNAQEPRGNNERSWNVSSQDYDQLGTSSEIFRSGVNTGLCLQSCRSGKIFS